MADIQKLFEVDLVNWVLTALVIMMGVVALANLIGKFSVIIGKPVKWAKQRETDHDTIHDLKRLHKDDTKAVNAAIKELQDLAKEFAENRVSDRQQSLEIQRQLSDAIASLKDTNKLLIEAQKELLAEKINEKYKHYLRLGYIPADEYDEFVSLHAVYNGVGGNHHGDAKFNYCINNLRVVPDEKRG